MLQLTNNLTPKLRDLIKKEYSLPIAITNEPNFTYTLETIKKIYNVEKILNDFNEIYLDLGENGIEQEFSKVINQIVNTISKLDIYKELEADSLSQFDCDLEIKVSTKDIYSYSNRDKNFISIDLVKANYQSMSLYNKELVLNSNSWEDFIKKFTKYDFIINSKKFRQVVMGKLLPKKQRKISLHIIKQITNVITKDLMDRKDDSYFPISISGDELVIELKDEANVKDCLDKIKKALNIPGFEDYKYRIEAFNLQTIGNRAMFVKEHYDNNKYEFKTIPSNVFLQAYKKYFNEPLENMDMEFITDGYIVQFKESIFN